MHYEVVRDGNPRGRTIHATMAEAIEQAQWLIAKNHAKRVVKVYCSTRGAFKQVAKFTA